MAIRIDTDVEVSAYHEICEEDKMPAAVATADVRDLVVVIAGVIWIILLLIRLAIAAGTLYIGRKLVRLGQRQVDQRVQPALEKALSISQSVRDRTARFPGAPGSTGGPTESVSA